MLPSIVKLQGDPEVIHESGSSVAVGHKVYLFGGYPNPRLGRPVHDQIIVYILNTVSLRWTMVPTVTTPRGKRPCVVPCSRRCHTAVLIGDNAYIWGGMQREGEFLKEKKRLYGFDVDTHRWLKTEVSGSVPETSRSHSACVLRKDMYVYGGANRLGVVSKDVYKLDTTTMVWSLINTRGTPPSGSWSHSASIMGTKMYVFGGEGNQDNNISVFDTKTNCWLSIPSAQLRPGRRYGHAAFAYNGELYIFGDEDLDLASTNLWKFSPKTFSWKEVKLNVSDPFWVIGDCCCMVGDRVIIFGRIDTGMMYRYDMYILDLSPSLKTLCQLAVIQYGQDQSELPHNIRWELAAMMTIKNLPRRKRKRKRKQ